MASNNKRSLGRGIDALFDENSEDQEKNKSNKSIIDLIPIEKLEPNPYQPRKAFSTESLKDLAESIKDRGILQPIIARKKLGETNQWQIIAGERRWRAAQLAGLHEVPIFKKNIKDEETAIIALIENIQREDLSPLEEAIGYKKIMKKFSMNQEQLAKSMKRSRAYVANFLRLLTLPKEIQNLIQERKITIGQARPIIGHKNNIELAKKIIKENLNARQVELLIKNKKSPTIKKNDKADINIISLEKDIEQIIGLKTIIKDKNGKGQIIFNYKNLDQLELIIAMIKR